MNPDEILFPHETIRDIQDEMLSEVFESIKNKKDMIIHAPTGIGKTVSVLAPALTHALKEDLTVFFLTSRHTQHEIAIKTLKEIKKKHGNNFGVVDIIGKKWMCLQGGVERLYSSEFSEYCKKLKEENKCEFYSRIKNKNKLSVNAEKLLSEVKAIGAISSEELIDMCREEKLCPYEISSILCKKAKVIIGDYYHIFNDIIRKNIFSKAGIELSGSIIIIDEGHNLPARMRNLNSIKLSSIAVERAMSEAKKFGYSETLENINIIKNALLDLSKDLNFNKEEKNIKKHEFIDLINKNNDYEQLLNDLIFIGEEVREKQKQSFIGSIGNFLDSWQGTSEGYARIISTKEGQRDKVTNLSYICMDPSLSTRTVIESSYSTILMSGTLTPTSMYRDVLGFDNAIEKVYPNPFPEKNKLSLVIPQTTTKYTRRNEEEFEKISNICSKITNIIKGNSIIFFPSYYLRDKVYKYFFKSCEKTIFLEKPNLSKQEKIEMLENFARYKKAGAVLLGVASGSFGEGVDLPGDLLKSVIVAGLPLDRPSLEVKELIEYYEDKFGKGWDYGYIYPAIIKCLQNAGRCIRTETDKGVIAFLDERFSWPNYFRCFPPDMSIKITKMYEERIKEFFG